MSAANKTETASLERLLNCFWAGNAQGRTLGATMDSNRVGYPYNDAHRLGFKAGRSDFMATHKRGYSRDPSRHAVGGAVDLPINAFLYILTHGGDSLPMQLDHKSLPRLADAVQECARAFVDTAHKPPGMVRHEMETWLRAQGIVVSL